MQSRVWTTLSVLVLVLVLLRLSPHLCIEATLSIHCKPSAFLRNGCQHSYSRPRVKHNPLSILCKNGRQPPPRPRPPRKDVRLQPTKMSISGRMQTSLLHCFWSLATKIGMRRLGDLLKRWYPSAYGDSIFYFRPTPDQYPAEKVALTIDDGLFRAGNQDKDTHSSSMVQEVCDLLRSFDAHATFFVCTNYTTPQQAQEVLREGHEIGNHLKEDRSGYYGNLKEDEFARELDEANRILEAVLLAPQDGAGGDGGDKSGRAGRIKWFRAPQGIMSRAMCKVLRDRGLVNILGDCYCDDWAFAEKTESTSGVVAPLMLRQAQDGSIAIFHMPQRHFRESTFDALREFLQGMQQHNLKCVTVSEMMDTSL